MLDPAVNPQIVNNDNEVSIRLLRYLETIGSSSLPLTDTPPDLLKAAEEVREMRESGELPPGTGGTVVPSVPPSDGDGPQAMNQGSSAASTTSDRPRLGGLKMYQGRAERRLHQRADQTGEADDDPSSNAPSSDDTSTDESSRS